MDWFRRHLNWTVVLAWVASFPLSYIVGSLIQSINPYISTGTYYLIGYTIQGLWLLGIAGWVLRKKNRSLWNLLWLFVPFGWIVFLCLENRAGTIGNEFISSNLREEVGND